MPLSDNELCHSVERPTNAYCALVVEIQFFLTATHLWFRSGYSTILSTFPRHPLRSLSAHSWDTIKSWIRRFWSAKQKPSESECTVQSPPIIETVELAMIFSSQRSIKKHAAGVFGLSRKCRPMTRILHKYMKFYTYRDILWELS